MPRTRDLRNHAVHLLAIALLALHAALAWVGRPAGVATRQDDAVYLLLARSLREFGYQNLYYVNTPPHGLYPPGYPAMLAVWGGLFGDGFDGLALLSVLASTATLGLIYLVMRRLASPVVRLLVLAVLAVNPYLIQYGGDIASEAPYMLLSVLALWLLVRQDKVTTGTLVLVGVVAVAAALTRAVGAALLLALGIHWLLERRWRAAGLLTAASAVAVGGWLWWASRVPHAVAGHSYVADATHRADNKPPAGMGEILFERTVDNVPNYLAISLPYRLPIPTLPGTLVDNVLGALIVTLGLVAGVWLLWGKWRPAALYILAYGAVLAVWPWQVGRFLVPMLPLLVPAIVLGLGEALRGVRPAWSAPAMATLMLVLLGNGFTRTTGELRQKGGCERGLEFPSPTCVAPDQSSFFAALRYIRANLPSEAVLLTAKPEPLYYYTARRASPTLPSRIRAESLLPELYRTGTGYVLLGSLQAAEPTRLADALAANCRRIEPQEFFPPRTYLFRVLSQDAPDGEQAGCEAVAEYRRLNQGRNFEADE